VIFARLAGKTLSDLMSLDAGKHLYDARVEAISFCQFRTQLSVLHPQAQLNYCSDR
jgi:hypothetical protein